jgi:pimeloyl-ACP methyl ester carboxylesterase
MRAYGIGRAVLVATMIAGVCAFGAPAAGATALSWVDGYDDAATPNQFDKVGVLKEGPADARKILILLPGTSAGAGYFEPLAQDIVSKTKDWQVWMVERRENLLEDQSRADMLKRGEITPTQFNNYYLGWIINPTNPHVGLSTPGLGYANDWGMRVAVEDVKRVVAEARKHSRQVVLGGHSLGGSITTAYATWDFDGQPGARDLSGLVFIDGGSGPASITPAEAQAAEDDLVGNPWLAFGGIPAPFAGLFSLVGPGLAKTAPNEPSLAQQLPVLPPALKPPVTATNEAQYGYDVDADTSPTFLAAAQVHAGQLADSGDPRAWVSGELSPIQRVADAFFGTGLIGIDGSAWYHPARLTLDSRAVGAGIANPAQNVLDVHSTHGSDLDRHLPLYAFATALGGQRVLDAAQLLAAESKIRSHYVTLVDDSTTYAHVDPITAYPRNDFVDKLIPFLRKTHKVK